MSPKDEWEKVIVPQFDSVTQDKLKSWRKRSLRYMNIGAILMCSGTLMIGIWIGATFLK